jgi:hypothetical protein
LIKADDTLDEIVVRELGIGLYSVLDMDLSFKNKAWLDPPTFDQFLECRLVLAQRNDSSSDSLRLEPGLGERNLEDTFLLLGICGTYSRISFVYDCAMGSRLTGILRGVNANDSNTTTSSGDIDRIYDDGIANVYTLGIHTFVSDTVARSINAFWL